MKKLRKMLFVMLAALSVLLIFSNDLAYVIEEGRLVNQVNYIM